MYTSMHLGILPVIPAQPAQPGEALPWGVDSTTPFTRAGARTAGAKANSLKLLLLLLLLLLYYYYCKRFANPGDPMIFRIKVGQ